MTTHVPSVGTQAETLSHGPQARGVYGAIVAAAGLVIRLCAFATGHVSAGSTAVTVAVVLGAATTLWLLHTHRQVRKAELRRHAENSNEPATLRGATGAVVRAGLTVA